jgi:hypothetical protein
MMEERKIPPTEGLEMYLNASRAIVLKQQPFNDETQIIIINPSDVEIVRKWLLDLYIESETREE